MLALENSDEDVAYTDAIATYLSMGVSRLSDICNVSMSMGKYWSKFAQVQKLSYFHAKPSLCSGTLPNPMCSLMLPVILVSVLVI